LEEHKKIQARTNTRQHAAGNIRMRLARAKRSKPTEMALHSNPKQEVLNKTASIIK